MPDIRINYKLIRMYLDSGKKLFPICRKKEFGRVLAIKEQGKKPLHKNYTQRDYPADVLFDYVLDGHNLGWQIGPGQIVVDVDPRNGGDESLLTLLKDIGSDDLGDMCPTVNTGGGGTHYYFQIPDGAPDRFKKNNKTRYPGIDFQKEGQYVVIPGAWHYEAKAYYSWDELSPYQLAAPDLPLTVVNQLAYKKQTNRKSDGSGELTSGELKDVLDQIPVEEYDNHDLWFKMLCASHYATDGEGDQVFIDWSMGDENYQGQENTIQGRWDSLQTDVDDPTTTETLWSHLRTHGGIPPKNKAVNQFGEFLESQDVIDRVKKGKEKGKPSNPLRNMLDDLDDESNSRQINDALKSCLSLNAVQVDMVIRDISKNTKIARSALRKQLQELKTLAVQKEGSGFSVSQEEADLRDLVQQVVAILLRENYDNGRRLRFTDDSNFWFYDGCKWSPYFKGFIARDIYTAMMTLRTEIPDIEFEASRVLLPAQKILEAKVACEIRMHDPIKGRPPIINLLDCELWINPRTGKLKKRKHSPESNLTYCLEIELDTGAECPLFDETLEQLFEKEDDADEIIRHLWEVFGYIIQPRKNIASWFMLFGQGNNGKTVILEILSALLGDAVLEQSITDFEARNSFAREELPGKLLIMDDDVTAKTILPDEFMKKMSENKTVSVPRKFKSNIRFRATSTILLACNDMPRTKDTSYGFYRRVMVFPFRRVFRKEEENHDLGEDIVNTELPGILISALRGLQRLRKRGNFDVPRVCLDMATSWRDNSNPLYGFISDNCSRDKRKKAKASSLWNLYQYWAEDNGIGRGYRMAKRTLFSSLENMGFTKYRGTGGHIYFKGLHIVVDIEEEEQ